VPRTHGGVSPAVIIGESPDKPGFYNVMFIDHFEQQMAVVNGKMSQVEVLADGGANSGTKVVSAEEIIPADQAENLYRHERDVDSYSDAEVTQFDRGYHDAFNNDGMMNVIQGLRGQIDDETYFKLVRARIDEIKEKTGYTPDLMARNREIKEREKQNK
jgi:hypothetical protein